METLTLHYSEEFEDRNRCLLFEQIIHKTLRHRRRRGEWFNISVQEAIQEVQYAIIRYDDDDMLKYMFKEGLIQP